MTVRNILLSAGRPLMHLIAVVGSRCPSLVRALLVTTWFLRRTVTWLVRRLVLRRHRAASSIAALLLVSLRMARYILPCVRGLSFEAGLLRKMIVGPLTRSTVTLRWWCTLLEQAVVWCLLVLASVNWVSSVLVILFGLVIRWSPVMSMRPLCLASILLMVVNRLARSTDVWMLFGCPAMLNLWMMVSLVLGPCRAERTCIMAAPLVLPEFNSVNIDLGVMEKLMLCSIRRLPNVPCSLCILMVGVVALATVGCFVWCG